MRRRDALPTIREATAEMERSFNALQHEWAVRDYAGIALEADILRGYAEQLFWRETLAKRPASESDWIDRVARGEGCA